MRVCSHGDCLQVHPALALCIHVQIHKYKCIYIRILNKYTYIHVPRHTFRLPTTHAWTHISSKCVTCVCIDACMMTIWPTMEFTTHSKLIINLAMSAWAQIIMVLHKTLIMQVCQIMTRIQLIVTIRFIIQTSTSK